MYNMVYVHCMHGIVISIFRVKQHALDQKYDTNTIRLLYGLLLSCLFSTVNPTFEMMVMIMTMTMMIQIRAVERILI